MSESSLRLYDEAVHAVRTAPACTGADRHRLGLPMWVRIVLAIAGPALAAFTLLHVHHLTKITAYPFGIGLGLALGAGFGYPIRGDRVGATFFGLGRRKRLSEVTRVACASSGQGAQGSLRLYAGPRLITTIPLRGRFAASAEIRAHLVQWLNRPDMVWEPSARAALGIDATVDKGRDETPADLPPVVAGAGPTMIGYAIVLVLLGPFGGLAWATQPGEPVLPGYVLGVASVALALRLLCLQVVANPTGLRIKGLLYNRRVPWTSVRAVSVVAGPWWVSSRTSTPMRVRVTLQHGRSIGPLALCRPDSDPRLAEFTEYASARGVTTGQPGP